jgi:zinc protease
MNPRRAILLVVFLLAGLTPASAASVKTLNAVKGAQVWFAEDHTVPMIVLTASLPAGSAYDPSAKAGLAALAAYLLDEGAGNLDSAAFQTALANRAIQLNVSPGRDFTTVSLTVLSSDAKEAFRLLGLALFRPRFDAEAVNRVRAQMLQSLETEEGNPESAAEKSFYSFYFGAHAYGHAPEGSARGLMAIAPGDLKTFARTHWVRGGLRIALAGDTSAAAATALLRSAFGALPGQAPPPPPPAPGRVGAPGLHVVELEVPQPVAIFALPGLLRSDPDFLAGYVANYILGGGGFASRLTREVREKRGLTYDISTDLVPYRGAGLLLGAVAAKKDSMRQTIAVVRLTMRKFAADGPTQQELDDAKTYLNGSFPLTFASDAGLAVQLNVFQQMGLGIDYLDKRAGLIDAITLGDVRRAARRLCDPSKMTIVVAGSLPEEKGNSSPSP